jgi:hypothetical protein
VCDRENSDECTVIDTFVDNDVRERIKTMLLDTLTASSAYLYSDAIRKSLETVIDEDKVLVDGVSFYRTLANDTRTAYRIERRARQNKALKYRMIDKNRSRADAASRLYKKMRDDVEAKVEEDFKYRIPVMIPPDYDNMTDDEQVEFVYKQLRSSKNTELKEDGKQKYKTQFTNFDRQFKHWIRFGLKYNEFVFNSDFNAFKQYVQEYPEIVAEYEDRVLPSCQSTLDNKLKEMKKMYTKLSNSRGEYVENLPGNRTELDKIEEINEIKQALLSFLPKKQYVKFFSVDFYETEAFQRYLNETYEHVPSQLEVIAKVIEQMEEMYRILNYNVESFKQLRVARSNGEIRKTFEDWYVETLYKGYRYIVDKKRNVIEFLEYISIHGVLRNRKGNPLLVAKAFETSITKFLVLGSPDFEVIRSTYKSYNDWLISKEKHPHGVRKRWYGLDWALYLRTVSNRQKRCEFIYSKNDTSILKTDCIQYDWTILQNNVTLVIDEVIQPCFFGNKRTDKLFREIVLILYLFTLQPPRRSSDYCNMRIVTGRKTEELKKEYQFNYYQHDKKIFVFNRFKTSLYAKSQVVDVKDQKLKNYLDIYVDVYEEGMLLLPFKDEKQMLNRLKWISKSLCLPFRINSLRHFYATWVSEIYPESEYQKYAIMMGTSSEMMSRHYIDSKKLFRDDFKMHVFPSRVLSSQIDIENNELDIEEIVEEQEF